MSKGDLASNEINTSAEVLLVDEVATAVGDKSHPWAKDTTEVSPPFPVTLLDFKALWRSDVSGGVDGSHKLIKPDFWGISVYVTMMEGWEEKTQTGNVCVTSIAHLLQDQGILMGVTLHVIKEGCEVLARRVQEFTIPTQPKPDFSLDSLKASMVKEMPWYLEAEARQLEHKYQESIRLMDTYCRLKAADVHSFGWQVAKATFRLLNCKNVTVVPCIGMDAVSRVPKGGIVFKTLAIDGVSIRHEGGGQATGDELRHHVCRGHFKTYTADAPLFGRYVGRVWCPAHTRGKKERGEVIKKYIVRPSG